MTFGDNFLPLTGWTLYNATIDAGVLNLLAGGTASITFDSIDGVNVLPEGLQLYAESSNFPAVYTPTAFVHIHIEYLDGNTFDATAPLINNNTGSCLAIFTPTVSNYTDFDVSIFNSITVTFYCSVDISLTTWELKKSLSDAVKTNTKYYGIEISSEEGFKVSSTDGSSEAVFNSDTFAMRALVNDVMTDKIYFDPAKGTYVFDGELSADIINALSVLISPNLYAEKATISELTVDQLDTSTKVQNYLNSDTSDVNYIKIVGQTIQFITASTDGSATEQATDRNGNLLYWTDNTYAAAGTDETGYPVMVYTYTELVKQSDSFYSDGSQYVPQIILGAGSGVGTDYGKGFIYKATDGLYIKYLHSQTGEELVIKLTDDGLDLSDFPTVTFKENVVYQGICQLWVQTDTPVGAKTNDVWVDTDDYTRYDKAALTASATLSESDGEVVTASGTITITLHAATTAGIIKKIYNVGTGVVTVAGTINGETNLLLYPGESAELVTDGSGWRY